MDRKIWILHLLRFHYSGNKDVTAQGKKCLNWRSFINGIGHLTGDMFPEGVVPTYHNLCRNPTGHPAGPWCVITYDEPGRLGKGRDFCFELCGMLYIVHIQLGTGATK